MRGEHAEEVEGVYAVHTLSEAQRVCSQLCDTELRYRTFALRHRGVHRISLMTEYFMQQIEELLEFKLVYSGAKRPVPDMPVSCEPDMHKGPHVNQ